MRYAWPTLLLLTLTVFLLSAPRASAQWHDDTHPILMTPPQGWSMMGDPLLTEVQRTVRLVTPGPYRVGYQAFDNEVLLFPYLLVQYMPYTDLPEEHRPTYRLDEHATLQLVARLVKQFGADDPLPEDMTPDAFALAYDRSVARLVGVGSDGTFELAGAFPLQGGGQQEFHTFGRVGREGVAFVTVSTNEGVDTVAGVISGVMRTLAFDEGAGFAALPEREPEVVGFLPPPAEPLPSGALLLGEGSFGVLPGAGYVPLPAGSFDPREPRVLSVMPEVLGGLTLEHVLTVTPTSRRITRPWAAGGYAALDTLGFAGPMERRPSVAQWAQVLTALVGGDRAVTQRKLEQLADGAGQDGLFMVGEEAGDAPPWRVESVEMEAGRVALSRRLSDVTDATLLTQVEVTLVVGREGVAVLASESYRDATEEDIAALSAMHASVRFVGGKRLVDVPPTGEGGGEGDETAPVETDTPPGEGPDPAAPAQLDGGTGTDSEAATTPIDQSSGEPDRAAPEGSTIALPLVLGGLGVVFLGIVVVVVLTSHAKANRRREKARARRERQSGAR